VIIDPRGPPARHGADGMTRSVEEVDLALAGLL